MCTIVFKYGCLTSTSVKDAENKKERTKAAEIASPSIHHLAYLSHVAAVTIMAKIATSNNEYK
jgi:hypothetical protein